MRMWNVETFLMCRKHLLGEHVEMHMFAGCIRRGTSLAGYVGNGLVDTTLIRERHDALAAELHRRGMVHRSPLPDFSVPPAGHVDPARSWRELASRCPDCRAALEKWHG